MVEALESLQNLNAEQLRELAVELIARVAQQSQIIAAKDGDLLYRQAKIDKLTHELATLKRWKFGRSSELLNAGQVSLLDETIDADIADIADIAAIEEELRELAAAAKSDTQPRQQPKCAALPAGLPRVDILSHSVLHADATPVAMLKPGNKKTHRAYLWAYAPGAFEDLRAVVYVHGAFASKIF